MPPAAAQPEVEIHGLHATTPMVLPFAPTSVGRAFLLERDAGNLLIYNTDRLDEDTEALRARGDIARQYLNHWHEAMFGLAPAGLAAELSYHQADAAQVAEHGGDGVTFSQRHRVDEDFEVIPIPGHTPGAAAYLWDNGDHRLLFTGDTIYLHEGKWRAGLLESSDRERFVESLELIRELEFDVLVPWVVDAEDPYLVPVDTAASTSTTPSVTLVRRRFPSKQVKILTPPGRRSTGGLVRASGLQATRIKRIHVERALLPQRVLDASGTLAATRPAEYEPRT